MKVQDLDLRFDMNKKVKIVRVYSEENIKFEGMTGTLTNPFGEFELTDVGVMLNEPKDLCDTINLSKVDEVELLPEGELGAGDPEVSG